MEVVKIVNGKLSENAYLVYDENRIGLIIDPGEQPEKIINEVNARGIDVTHIFLTHGHFDHISCTDEIKKKFNAKVCIYEDDAICLGDPDYNLSGRFTDELRLSAADIILKDGDELKVGSMDIKVLHTPGHSKGSCSYIIDNYIFSGDTLFLMSVGRVDLIGGSESDIKDSLNKLKAFPNDYIVCPGHGQNTSIGFEKKNNDYMM